MFFIPLGSPKDKAEARIELKEDGHDLRTEREHGKNRFGHATRYARYSFGKGEGNENQA